MAQIMDQYAAGGASNDVTLTLTFRYADRDGKYLEAGEAGASHKPAAASIREQIAQAGGGAARALGMEEITRMVRVAYDPAAQETIEESDEPRTSHGRIADRSCTRPAGAITRMIPV